MAMVSDIVKECNGYSALIDKEFKEAQQKNPKITKQVTRQLLQYGESREGY